MCWCYVDNLCLGQFTLCQQLKPVMRLGAVHVYIPITRTLITSIGLGSLVVKKEARDIDGSSSRVSAVWTILVSQYVTVLQLC